VVTEDADGQVIGQGICIPARWYVQDREVKGLRLSAPLLRKSLRFGILPGPDHPFIGMGKKVLELARDDGYSLLYSIPRRQFLSLMRFGPLLGLPSFSGVEFGCAERTWESLRNAPVPIPKHLEVHQVSEFGPEYDELWEDARVSLPIQAGLVRKSSYLQFRNGGHLVLEVRRSAGPLLGYVALRKNSGLIDDMLARTLEDLQSLLAAALGQLAREPDLVDEYNIEKVKAMTTPYLDDVLGPLGLQRIKFRFAYACHCLDGSLSPNQLNPSAWYVTPGD
jgi:hypothetical protein